MVLPYWQPSSPMGFSKRCRHRQRRHRSTQIGIKAHLVLCTRPNGASGPVVAPAVRPVDISAARFALRELTTLQPGEPECGIITKEELGRRHATTWLFPDGWCGLRFCERSTRGDGRRGRWTRDDDIPLDRAGIGKV